MDKKEFGICYTTVNGLNCLSYESVDKLIEEIEDLRLKLILSQTTRQNIAVLKSIYRRLLFGNAHPLIIIRYWRDNSGKSGPNSFGEKIWEEISDFNKRIMFDKVCK